MNYTSFVRHILSSTWMVAPSFASVYFPILKSTLMGLEFTPEEPVMTSYIKKDGSKAKEIDSNNSFIAIHSLSGVMLKHDQECGPVGTITIANQILNADKNANIIGHIILTESGGGASNSVPVIADAIKAATKPVVALIDGIAASAAIYAISYSDYILANNEMDMIGCVGTMMEFAGFPSRKELQSGEIYIRVYADQSTEKNADIEQALGGDVRMLKENILNPMTEIFISEMKKNRPNMKEDQLKGQTFFARDVVGSFIDEIGGIEKAINKVVELSSNKGISNNASNNNNMNLSNLEKIPSCAGLIVQEGSSSLNTAQLSEIDQQIGELISLRENISNANAQITNLTNENATLRTRVTELEAFILNNSKNALATAAASTAPVEEAVESPMEFCKNLKNKLS